MHRTVCKTLLIVPLKKYFHMKDTPYMSFCTLSPSIVVNSDVWTLLQVCHRVSVRLNLPGEKLIFKVEKKKGSQGSTLTKQEDLSNLNLMNVKRIRSINN